MKFTGTFKNNWLKSYKKLLTFKKKYGHTNVPFDYKDKMLFQWVNNQKKAKSQLPKEALEKLKIIDFDFNSGDHFSFPEMLAALKAFAKKFNTVNVPPSFSEYQRLYDWIRLVRQSKSRLKQKEIDQLDKLNFDWQPVDINEAQWEFMFKQLKDYKKEFGHVKVPAHSKEHKKLSIWVVTQRGNEEKLSKERKRRLTELGFVWKRDIENEKERAWMEKYKALQKFYKNNGHSRYSIKSKENLSLGKWVQRQREQKETMNEKKRSLLDKIEFVWQENLQKQKEDDWWNKYERLKEYYKKYKKTRVNASYRQDPGLKDWTYSLRIKGKDVLSEAKIKALKKIGFEWEINVEIENEERWKNRYNLLKAYYDKHGISVYLGKIIKDKDLAQWIRAQRQKKEIMPSERRKKLEKIGFVWNANEAYWDEMYSRLVQFYKRHKHSRVPWGWEEDPDLATWVYSIRNSFNNYPEEKIALLKKVKFLEKGFAQKDFDELWEQRYSELAVYYKKYGHSKVPHDYEPNKRLANWVGKIRGKKEQLSKDKIKRLNALKFHWEKKQDENNKQWEEKFKELKFFYDEHKHFKVPVKNNILRGWVDNQKKVVQSMPEERKKKLDGIGFFKKEDPWEQKYSKLKEFYKKNKHTNVPKEMEELRNWKYRQTARYDDLSKERKRKLKDIGIVK